jgi:hypothetical protein
MAAPLPVTVGAAGNATVFPPVMPMLPDAMLNVGCGTSKLNVFAAMVVELIAPEVTIVASDAEGSGTVLPPLMLKLPELMVNVGCGTVTV